MTAARVKSTGSGVVRFVVCIEGIRERAVNLESDVSDNVNSEIAYLNGLQTKGWVFTERIDLIAAKLDAESITVQIADIGGRWTQVFDTAPTFTNYLTADLTDTDETINVLGTTGGFPAQPQPVYIGMETLLCDGTTATTIGGPGDTTRGYYRSYPTYHYQYDGGSTATGFTPVTDLPMHFEGRVVEFFMYDASETIDIRTTLAAGGDSPFWTGIISTEPKFDGATWSFTVDSILSRLKQKLGAQLGDPLSIRGIYYPASAPFAIQIEELGSSARFSTTTTAFTTLAMSGFWETQEEFCAALNTQLDAMMTGSAPGPISGTFTQTLRAFVKDDGSWAFEYTTAVTPHWMYVWGLALAGAVSALDGIPATYAVAITGPTNTTVSASTRYEIPLLPQPGLSSGGSVPRAYYGASSIAANVRAQIPADAHRINVDETTFPQGRIYVGGSAALVAAGTAALVSWDPNGIGLQVSTDVKQTVLSTDASTRSIVTRFIVPGNLGGDPHGLVATSANKPEIRIGIDLGEGTLADMLATLLTLSPRYAPLGVVPMLRTYDVSPGDLAAAASVSTTLATRRWILFSEHDFEELVQQELRLLGCYPCIGGSGQITFKRLRFGAAGEAPAASLTSADFIGDNAKFYSYERAPYGLVNLWTLKTGYDALEDNWSGDEINVIDLESRANSARVREMKIKPFSVEAAQNLSLEQLITEAQKLAANVLGVFGGPYKILTCRVPLTRMLNDAGTALTVGSVLSITWAKPPNGDGTKGLNAKIGVLVGRSIHPRAAYIEATILLTDQRVGGYVPGAKIASIDSGASGSTGSFTITPTLAGYFPSGADLRDFWEAGDKIRVYKWNNATPGIVTGTITAVTATQVTFTSDAAWTHAGSSWVIDSQVSTSVSSAKQKQYAYIATATGFADFSDEDLSPYTFA